MTVSTVADPDKDAEIDAALFASMAAGDRAAISTLYAHHASVLLGLAVRIVGERREAENLLHDVFLEAWRSATDFDPARERARAWLAIRMRSRALDHRKSARVSCNAVDVGLEPAVDNSKPGSRESVRVRVALASLGDKRRRVIELAYFDGLSCTEIAEQLKISVGTVKSHVTAGLDRLRPDVAAPGRLVSWP